MNFGYISASAVFVFALACADDGGNPSSGGAGAGAGGDGPTGGTGGQSGDCGSASLCIDVEGEWQGDSVVAALWVRKVEQKLVDPVVGFVQAFDPAAPTITIPLGLVTEPPEHALTCARACEDPMTCPCEPGFAIGLALITVVADDGMGGVDLVAFEDGDAQGYASAMIVFSEEAQASAPPMFDLDFPQGIAAGISIYQLSSDGAFEPAAPGARYELISTADL